jgi:hypothetical protein
METYDPAADPSLYVTRALDLARAIVDPIAFTEGVGLLVYLDEIVLPGKEKVPLIHQHSKLKHICTAFAGDGLEELQKLSIQDPQLHRALNDLVVSITFPGPALVNCARAIETLRRIMYPAPDPSRKQGWQFMQQELHIDSSYIRVVTDASVEPRHGSRWKVDELLADKVIVHTWTIFNRYLEYRKNNNQRLPASKFRLLV